MKAIFLYIPLLLICCSPKTTSENAEESDGMEIFSDSLFLSQHCVIYLQPYDDFSKKEAEELMPILKEAFNKWLYGYWCFRVLEPTNLPKDSWVKEKNKYRVSPILDSQSKIIKGNVAIIGLTHKDICTNIHGVEDYGIVGMSRPLMNVCVVSDKRLKNKSLIWKPVLHEFFHTIYGAEHCSNDDPTCFMKDAKGHGNFEIQDKLCNSCHSFMMMVERKRIDNYHGDKNVFSLWGRR